jgi:hypothetical protein
MSRDDEGVPAPRNLWKLLFLHQLPLETETTLFILVNTLDYFATYWLLHDGGFHERNPVARLFLEGWGLTKGLLLYKLCLVGTVCLIAQIVATKRLRTAQRLLNFGSLVVGGVVVYSVRLYVQHN